MIIKKIVKFMLCGSLFFNFQANAVNIDNMTLDEKLGQMICLGFKYLDDDTCKKANGQFSDILDDTKIEEVNELVRIAITQYHVGGVVLFSQNLFDKEQSINLIKDLKSTSINSGNPPLIVAVDQEGGRIERFAFGRERLKNNADIKTSKEAFEKGILIAKELKEIGVNCNFAPVVDVNSNPDNPVINVRSFGDNPDIVAKFGRSFLKGLHEENIIGTAKHFPGHGDTSVDSHMDLPVVNKNLNDLEKLELKPFKTLSDAGVDMVMIANIALPKIEKETVVSKKTGEKIYLPATLSKTVINKILRNKIGFQGVVITDAINMKAISDNYSVNEASKMAIQAGNDMLCMPIAIEGKDDIAYLGGLFRYLKKAVASGEISEKQIDASVERILKLKEKYCK